MRKFLTLFLFLFTVHSAKLQTQLVSDNFGTTAQNPINRTGWTADAASGTAWELRITGASSGYSWTNPVYSASGTANVFTNLGTNNNTKTLTYNNNLSTVGYSSIKVRFGVIKSGTVNSLDISWSSDGINWNSASSVTMPTSWTAQTISLPAGAEGLSNLQIRFSTAANSNTSNSFRIDDFQVIGTVSCNAPSNSPTNFSTSNIGPSSMDVSWTNGNGDMTLVVAKAGSAVNADPSNGSSYSANASFGSGSQIGTGNYVVYNGSGSSFTLSGLSTLTNYHFAIYSYNSTENCYNLSELTGNTTSGNVSFTSSDVRINEVDSDTPGVDASEFVELYGSPNLSLNGVVIVFYNGNDDKSYYSYDLDGKFLDANGFFILGNSGAPGNPDVTFANDFLQNGADAVAIYNNNGTAFPNGTNVTSTNLIDALVYDTNDADDAGLLTGLGQMEQIDENVNNQSADQSIQRGSWFVSTPTPRAQNVLPIILESFEIRKNNLYSFLSFTTASEANNDFFTIERSADGSTFEAIGTIKGAGNSSREITYEFTDEAPLRGLNYYRIKQTDFDGKYSYSEVRSVRFTDASTITVSPRTTEGRIYVTTDMEDYEVSVFSASGARVRNLSGLSADQSISIEDLQPGIYFIRVSSGTHSETVRVIKI